MLIVHLIYRLDVGGLERFMVDMVNRFPSNYKHAVISLTDATEFQKQLDPAVKVYCLGKKMGQDLGIHIKLAKLLRQINPDILHTYNLSTIEYHPIARLAGIKGHLHAEHGREITDPQGLNWKHNLLRRLVSPFIHVFVAVSVELEEWLINTVHIPSTKISMIPNGIELTKFTQNKNVGSKSNTKFVHVARLQAVKNQTLLLTAFNKCYQFCVANKLPLPRLTIVGDGPDGKKLRELHANLASKDCIDFMGMQADVRPFYKQSDVFVLSSVAEGTPMTILEAMASGLAIIATNVGGIPQLVNSHNGWLVESDNVGSMTQAMLEAILDPQNLASKGTQGLQMMKLNFNQSLCDKAYQSLYRRIAN